MKARITEKLVEGLKPTGEGDIYISDDGLTGFRLRLTKAGTVIFLFQYRSPDGRQRKMQLGTADTITVSRARALATSAADKVRQGLDPQADADRLAVTPSLQSAYDAFDQAHPEWKPKTRSEYRRMFANYVPAHLKALPVTKVDRSELAKLLRDMADRPYQANFLRTMLRSLFNWCEGDGAMLRPGENPAHKLKAYPAQKRTFVFEGDQAFRFCEALDKAEGTMWPPAVWAMRLLLFTGMRREEVMQLRWDEVDIEGRRIRLTEAKTGARPVPLGKEAIAVLERAKAHADVFGTSAYVFPSPKDRSKPIVGIWKMWRKVRKDAGLPDMRIHDLRHNYGGMAAPSTRSPVHVKGLLGHTQLATTDRYMSLAESPLNEAADATNEAISQAMRPKNVVSMRR